MSLNWIMTIYHTLITLRCKRELIASWIPVTSREQRRTALLPSYPVGWDSQNHLIGHFLKPNAELNGGSIWLSTDILMVKAPSHLNLSKVKGLINHKFVIVIFLLDPGTSKCPGVRNHPKINILWLYQLNREPPNFPISLRNIHSSQHHLSVAS